MIAVSIPEMLLDKLDSTVESTGKKRSAIIREALEMYLQVIDKNRNEKGGLTLKDDISFYELLVTKFKKPKEFMTEARAKPFTVFSDEGKLYVLNAEGNTRRLSETSVNNFFNLFNETGSFSPSIYQGVTFNSSYLLAVLKELLTNETI